MAQSQADLIKEYFENNPNRDIEHQEVVDWLTTTYKARTGKVFRDPDRGIRKLYEAGFLQKMGKGVYRYDPDSVVMRDIKPFTPEQKKAIFERDGYRCVICGLGLEDGLELQVDHVLPLNRGGTSTLDNGQTLCAPHNFRKKNYSQTESGKRMFINLLNAARKCGDTSTEAFCLDILRVYERHNVNGHIEWS